MKVEERSMDTRKLVHDGMEENVDVNVVRLGAKGFQIYEYDTDDPVGKLAFIHFDVDNKRLQLGHRDPGGGYIADGYFYPDKDTGWSSLGNGISYRKKNGVVYLSAYGQVMETVSTETYVTIATLPEGARPSVDVAGPVFINTGSGHMGWLTIRTTGAVDIRCYTVAATSRFIIGNMCFPV